MSRWSRALILATLLAAPAIAAQQRPTAAADIVGVSSERLARLHRGMQGFVDRHEVGGIVTLLQRGGRVVDVHAAGWQDVESKKSMRADTIFRIASMSKPVTSVAVMMLCEEGRLSLADPLSRFIPAFRDMKVLVPGTGGAEPALVAARRPITIRDLLAHRSGLSYGFLDGGPVGKVYRDGGVSDGLEAAQGAIADNVEKLAKAPLVSQPGAEWHYSLSDDVLGRVIEVVSGQTFDAFLRDRIFTPLKMADTSFEVPESKWARFATVYTPDGNGGVRPMKDPESFGNTHMSPTAAYNSPKRYFSGGAGLVSTAHDYARFAQMLLNGGELDRARLVSPKTIELMTRSLTSDLVPTPGLIGNGAGWGLGFRIVTDLGPTGALGSDGMYGWSGIYGTNFWVDPKEKLVAVMMVQRYPGSTVAAAFQTLAYQAIVGPAVPLARPRTGTSR